MSNPYGSLEPEPPDARAGAGPLVTEAGWLTVLLRGARKRCPRCAERRIWDGWFTIKSRCPFCDLRFEREKGGFLGAMTLNYGMAVLAWVVVLIVGLVLTVPEVPVVPLLAVSIVVILVVPVWFYPRSKTIWAAIEFLVARSDPDYRTPVRRDPRARDVE
jgi:uncharacterized protein (DUF983 family)